MVYTRVVIVWVVAVLVVVEGVVVDDNDGSHIVNGQNALPTDKKNQSVVLKYKYFCIKISYSNMLDFPSHNIDQQ